MTDIFIIGSCVSRDILGYDNGQLKLADYFARTSFGSAFQSRHIPDNYSDALDSKFQRRLVHADLSKELPTKLTSTSFDILLVDFIDERFDLFQFETGAICTVSSELLKAGFLKHRPAGRVIRSGSDEFLKIWQEGWDQFIDLAKKHNILDRVHINRVFWAEKMNSGACYSPPYDAENIESGNALLRKLYAYSSKDIDQSQFLDYSSSLFFGADNHKWGSSPFHYIDSYYITALEKIRMIKGETNKAIPALSNTAQHLQRTFGEADVQNILAKKLDLISSDFAPLKNFSPNADGESEAVLPTGEPIKIDKTGKIDWLQDFPIQSSSSRMWLFSLATTGSLLSLCTSDQDWPPYELATSILRSYFSFIDNDNGHHILEGIQSADHSAATRIKVLFKYLQISQKMDSIDPDLLARVIGEIYYWANWLSMPSHYTRSNHGVMSDISLLHAGVIFADHPFGQHFVELAAARSFEMAEESFDSDGFCNENTIGYHRYNISLYRNLAHFIRHYEIEKLANGILSKMEVIIEKAEAALRQLIWQDGTIPPIGDSPLYPTNIASINDSKCYFESGLCVIKTNDIYLSLICGARSENHKQVDDTSITLRFRDKNIFIDGGSFLYNRANRFRRCVESSLGHSGIFTTDSDGLLRKEFLAKFGPVQGEITEFTADNSGAKVKAVYTILNGHIRFERNIFVSAANEVAIVDHIDMDRTQIEAGKSIVQRFILGPEFLPTQVRDQAFFLNCGDYRASLFQCSSFNSFETYRGQDDDQVRGWHSYDFGEIHPTSALEFIVHPKKRRVTLSTVISLSGVNTLEDCSSDVREYVSQLTLTNKGPHTRTEERSAYVDYAAWRIPIIECEDGAPIVIGSEQGDAIFRIDAGKTFIDVMYRAGNEQSGKASDPVVLVSFNGAVTDRNQKKGPFFSGVGVSRTLGIPLLAVADPIVTDSEDVGLAWYAGSEEVPDLLDQIADFLNDFSEKNKCRLILFGGSGGGFATLGILRRLKCKTTGLVWNPQTSISRYVPSFVQKYMLAATPQAAQKYLEVNDDGIATADNIAFCLTQAGIEHNQLTWQAPENCTLLYLQNSSDWHVQKHLAPFMGTGAWTRIGRRAFSCPERRVTTWLGEWGSGHEAPPLEWIIEAIDRISKGEPIETLAAAFDETKSANAAPFPWFPVRANADQLSVDIQQKERVLFISATIHDDICNSESYQFAFYFIVDGVRVAGQRYGNGSNAQFDIPANNENMEIAAFAKDGFGTIVCKTVAVTSAILDQQY